MRFRWIDTLINRISLHYMSVDNHAASGGGDSWATTSISLSRADTTLKVV
jgi:hypothetical protein